MSYTPKNPSPQIREPRTGRTASTEMTERRYPPDLSELAAVRAFLRAVIAERTAAEGDEVPFAEFVVSELATNAIVHAGGDFVVRVGVTPLSVRVEVCDDSEAMPVLARRQPAIHGLDLVDRLVHNNWGCVVDDEGGKTVWADVARRAAP